ncbi:AsmA family protein [Mesobacterium sp. TK19101]|uniref:AsmA family protein n=1 Tax=Mesobacterium hydrothermale TaxID=3111907 RepID=A0ABU6HL46_9RHOB|nr:AsmA family protein [Mesobacterium sp. TK19101]MEC3863175.1 AsmA family protein [Mesobacterium sp. TK19101]
MRLIFRLLGLVVVLVGIVVGALLLMPADRLGRLVSDQLTAQLGREVTLRDVRLTVWPVVGVEAGGVTLANAAWSDQGPMIEADRALIGLDAMDALSRKITIRALELDTPKVLLQTASNGQANWEFSSTPIAATNGQAQAAASPGGLPVFTLDKLTVTNGHFRLMQAGTDTVDLRDVDLDLAWPDPAKPASFDLSLDYLGAPVSLSGSVADPQVLAAGKAVPGAVTVQTRGGTVAFSGAFGTSPELGGKLTLDLPDTARFLAGLGIDGISVPKGLGQSIKGNGDVTLTKDGVFSLRGGALQLDQNALTAAADVFLGDKLRVNAQLDAGALDLSALAGQDSAGGGGTQSASEDGWSKDPIDASALGLLDGEIAIRASSISLGKIKFGETRTLVTIDRSRAVFDLQELNAWDGTVSGQFVANNRSGLSVGGDMKVTGIDLKQALVAAMDVDRLSGTGSMTLKFLGVGQSIDAILRSLKGDASIDAGNGVIAGIDLDRLINGGNVQGGTTVFEKLTGTFQITDGTLRGDDLVMILPRLTTRGEGFINIGARSMDYLLTVSSAEARGGRGLSIPVRLKGPWANLGISADLDELIDQNFQEEREKLKDDVRDRVNDRLEQELGIRVEKDQTLGEVVEDKLKDKLGVQGQDGQSVEDAVQQRLEDEAKKGLLKLLGR